jgi:hypothetical protein
VGVVNLHLSDDEARYLAGALRMDRRRIESQRAERDRLYRRVDDLDAQ